MDSLAIRTRKITREQIASAIGGNPRLIKLIEALTVDVSETVPEAVETAATNAEIAINDAADAMAAAQAAQAAADAALATAIAARVPVGGIHITVDPTDPATKLGYGTWVRFAKGRVVIGVDEADPDFDTVEETGGSKTATL